MADQNKPAPNKKIQLPSQDSGGFPAEKNLLLIFVLMGAALFVAPYFTKKVAPPPKPAAPKTETKAAPPEPAAPTATAAAATPTAGVREENFALETPLYKIVFSNKGGVIRSWVLKNFKDSAGKPLDLVNAKAIEKTGAPLSLAFPAQRPATDPNFQIFVHTFAPEGHGIDFEFANSQVSVKKSFRVAPDKYRMTVKTEVLAGGAAVPHNLNWRGGFGDLAALNEAGLITGVRFDNTENKLVLIAGKEAAENQPKVDKGTYLFAGIQDSYFAAVFIPRDARALEHRTYLDTVPNGANSEQLPGTSVGTPDGRNDFTIFAGPKDLDILQQTNAKLPQLIDWGTWFGWLAKPLFYGLRVVHGWVQGAGDQSWGWAIILITVIINFLLLPLKVTSLRSMKKMQALQPEMNKINKKYEGLSMKDPRMQNKNEEIMGLYKKHDVSPLGGCLPMMLQMPFLIALYTVLTVMIDLRQAKWLWVGDLSQPEQLAIRVLPLLMIASQFVIQKMTPQQPGQDPAQAKMMMFMPLMFGFMFYNAQSGLVLYWLVGNLVAMAQQWAFNKFIK